ncbi:MAG TPA: hypothetical protein IAB53_01425 [Candidatus Scybalocola faecipullorum]|nr:hypothetical protein [Candidatus Scybalocola faecipullorum]
MKHRLFICLAASSLLLTGCSAIREVTENTEPAYESSVTIGHDVTIDSIDPQLLLFNNTDTLSSRGLYYATWVIGDGVPYENSDGATIDLYDAQLYFLLSEANSADSAQQSLDSWLSSANENYNISESSQVTCAGLDYTFITYTVDDEESAYDRGVSAFTVVGTDAACIELTAIPDFDGDLKEILTSFLENCSFAKD